MHRNIFSKISGALKGNNNARKVEAVNSSQQDEGFDIINASDASGKWTHISQSNHFIFH